MSTEKKERIRTQVEIQVKGESPQLFSIFYSEDIKTDNQLAKLAQYATEADIERIVGLLNIRPDLRLQVLFALAGLGAQNEMETILTEYPEDLLAFGSLKDISGAEFERITLFQHTLWTTDVRYMAPMMLKCLPHNERGEKIRIDLLRQYNELMEKGVTYHLNGEKHEGSYHFNIDSVLNTLNMTNCWPYADLLPAHIRHHYCEPEASILNDELDFSQTDLKRSLKLRNWLMNTNELWAGPFKDSDAPIKIDEGWPVFRAELNLVSLPALYEMRTTIDMPALKKQLDTSILKLEETPKKERMSFTP